MLVSPHVDVEKTSDSFAVSSLKARGAIVYCNGRNSLWAAFAENDAIFNIGCAVAAIQLIEDGVYIAMNGQIFAADNVIKNRAQNRFESIL